MRHPFSLAILAFSLAAFPCLAATEVATTPACPVDLSAAQHSSSVLLPASQIHSDDPAVLKPHMAGGAHTLDFSVKNNQLAPIVSAEVAVHGTLHKGVLHELSASVTQLQARNPNEPSAEDVVRTIHLSGSISAGEEWNTFLRVHNLTTVRSVNIVALRYADGSTWTAGPDRSCSATVSPLMLIAAGK
jgi:hypothetical protein